MKDNQIAALPYWPRGLSRTLAASYVGVSPSTFDRMIKDGLMPRPKAVYGRMCEPWISLLTCWTAAIRPKWVKARYTSLRHEV